MLRMTLFSCHSEAVRPKNLGRRRACSGRMPFYGRDPRVPRRGQNCDCRRGREKGTVLRRREGAEGACTGDAPRLSRRVGKKTVTAAGGGRKEQFCGGEKERKEPAQATRRDYLDEWARKL